MTPLLEESPVATPPRRLVRGKDSFTNCQGAGSVFPVAGLALVETATALGTE